MIHHYTAEYLGLGGFKGLSLEQLFVRLCAYTTPYGSESMLLPYFPDDVFIDEDGNLQYYIPNKDGTDPIVQFCSHMDTACSWIERVNIKRTGDIIHTDGSTVLSADCKIGVAIMLKMIEAEIPGWYVFHVGEEKGCIGATSLAKRSDRWIIKPKISIEFDRHSYGSIITRQCMSRCCSEDFSAALAKQLRVPGYPPFKSDDGGIYTDNQEYMDIIPEVTNLSVGYFGHHTHKERQDIRYANLLLKALLKVDWNSLPIKRDPNDPSNLRQSYGGYAWRNKYTRGWGMDTIDSDPWDNAGNYAGTKWEGAGDTILSAAKPTDYIFPEKPEVTRDNHGNYLIKCIACDHRSEFSPTEMSSPFKFCEICDAPLDATTAEELEHIIKEQ